jgi:hypothetical protein
VAAHFADICSLIYITSEVFHSLSSACLTLFFCPQQLSSASSPSHSHIVEQDLDCSLAPFLECLNNTRNSLTSRTSASQTQTHYLPIWMPAICNKTVLMFATPATVAVPPLAPEVQVINNPLCATDMKTLLQAPRINHLMISTWPTSSPISPVIKGNTNNDA